jgi:hypothetical protein
VLGGVAGAGILLLWRRDPHSAERVGNIAE